MFDNDIVLQNILEHIEEVHIELGLAHFVNDVSSCKSLSEYIRFCIALLFNMGLINGCDFLELRRNYLFVNDEEGE